ncbi:2OG-Fe(II) oxygenase [Shewanella gelidimarina]|nr:2OG-Fe(II) oxygenase [Shewanella gelidimarina]
MLSVVVYLYQYRSKEHGGELVIYNNQQSTSAVIDDHTISVTPDFGSVVVFLNEEFPHEVLAAKPIVFLSRVGLGSIAVLPIISTLQANVEAPIDSSGMPLSAFY